WSMGSTNGVQPSWRLATITMHTMPSPSCLQRRPRRAVRGASIATADTIADLDAEKCAKQTGTADYGTVARTAQAVAVMDRGPSAAPLQKASRTACLISALSSGASLAK